MAYQLDQLSHANLGKSVHARLREALAAGRFRPNDRLRIRELALQLGAERHAGARRHAATGAGRSAGAALAARLSRAHAERGALPGNPRPAGGTRRTGRGDGGAADRGATLEQLEQLLLANQAAIARQDLAGALQCNQAFHLGLAQASGMSTLKRFVDHLWMQIGAADRRRLCGLHAHHARGASPRHPRRPACARWRGGTAGDGARHPRRRRAIAGVCGADGTGGVRKRKEKEQDD